MFCWVIELNNLAKRAIDNNGYTSPTYGQKRIYQPRCADRGTRRRVVVGITPKYGHIMCTVVIFVQNERTCGQLGTAAESSKDITCFLPYVEMSSRRTNTIDHLALGEQSKCEVFMLSKICAASVYNSALLVHPVTRICKSTDKQGVRTRQNWSSPNCPRSALLMGVPTKVAHCLYYISQYRPT